MKAECVGAKAEDGVPSLGSKPWAALEGSLVSVRTGRAKISLGSDNKVSHNLMDIYFLN